jgi:hypothetical protein
MGRNGCASGASPFPVTIAHGLEGSHIESINPGSEGGYNARAVQEAKVEKGPGVGIATADRNQPLPQMLEGHR